MATDRPQYSTWIRRQKMVLFWGLALAPLLAGAVAGLIFAPAALVGLLSLPFLFIAVIITLTAYRFSPRGGNFQGRIHDLLRGSLDPRGGVVDIGCGSGRLLIQIAKQNPDHHRGVDYWGKDWEYSQAQCLENGRREGVDNVEFLPGSASRLPLESGSAAQVVSCLTFHEVGDVEDKTDSLAEALRILVPGGRFAFFDLFADPAHYAGLDHVVRRIEGAQGTIETLKAFRDLEALPFPLDTPKVLKYAVLITGRKTAP